MINMVTRLWTTLDLLSLSMVELWSFLEQLEQQQMGLIIAIRSIDKIEILIIRFII